MTDMDPIGASLTPAEASYFETGGATEIPADETAGAALGDADQDGHERPDDGQQDIDAAPKPEKMVALAAERAFMGGCVPHTRSVVRIASAPPLKGVPSCRALV